MSRLQVLLATMDQQDLSIAERMNITCDAVIADQTDHDAVQVQHTPTGTWKMICTPTRGVGLNRNIALLAAEGELLLFSDDDVVYNDGMAQAVEAAFDENPKADVLIFGMDMVKDGVVTERRHLKKKRLHLWNALRYGTYTVAIRRSAVLRGGLSFHQCFGGGCMYSAGEDSLFIRSCFQRGLKVYSHDYVLGTCCKDNSSWFTAYDEKYFYDKGVLVRYLFPRNWWGMGLYFGIRFKRKTDVGMLRRIRLIYTGIRGGKTLQPYRGTR